MSTFSKVKRELAEQHQAADVPHDPKNDLLPCLRCATPTKRGTLSDLGARCFPCFQAYCRTPMTMQPRSSYAERVRAEIAAKGFAVPRGLASDQARDQSRPRLALPETELESFDFGDEPRT